MSISTFSVGRDTQLVVIGPTGRIDLAHVIAFESRQLTQSIRISRLDGTHIGMELPKGWEGSFELDRGDSVIEDFIAKLESDFYNGTVDGFGTMYQFVTEPDASISTYQFGSVVFRLVSAGQWRGDSAVKQKLEFYASKRTRI